MMIGKDYPKRIVDHDIVMKENLARMKQAYQAKQEGIKNDCLITFLFRRQSLNKFYLTAPENAESEPIKRKKGDSSKSSVSPPKITKFFKKN